ncbi:MAG: DNA polymerase III subunit gamma/tau [Gammaproteobacteria bacterium]|nr:DNA polymerase III subunit gamma/tau [Gammaproteobacteria bacterium]
MSYTALARSWRPRSFAEMTGQEHVLRSLANALGSGRIHHAFLFAGTRGVGKTTVARIFAKCLNCERGVAAEPCGECASCREIDAGRSVDLIEVDAASRTRVDDTRELLDNVQYAPTRSRYKIYLIDEVHMLSTHSFNALLKTLEEPPPHVKFLLATTDPQKLPVTVLSRCLQFNLKRLSQSLIAARLAHILKAEGIEHEAGAVQLLAGAGDGSLRDALSLLDQLIAYGNGRVSEADARAMLGTIDREHVVRLAELLAAGDAGALIDYARSLEDHSLDYAEVLEQLAALLERVALRQVIAAYEGDELHPPELLQRLAAALGAEDVQLYYQIALLGRRDLPLAPDPRTGFRMTLIRMLVFRPADAAAPGAPRPTTAAAAAVPPVAAGPSTATGVTAATAETVATATVPDSDWAALVARLDINGPVRELARHCVLLGRDGALVRLALDPRSASVRTRGREETLAQALGRHFGAAVRLEIEVRELSADTPARASERAALAELADARASLESDPTVAALSERFGATLHPESIRPTRSS